MCWVPSCTTTVVIVVVLIDLIVFVFLLLLCCWIGFGLCKWGCSYSCCRRDHWLRPLHGSNVFFCLFSEWDCWFASYPVSEFPFPLSISLTVSRSSTFTLDWLVEDDYCERSTTAVMSRVCVKALVRWVTPIHCDFTRRFVSCRRRHLLRH